MSNKELAERLREAHDLSLDDHHREARVSILEVAAAIEQQDAALAAQPDAPASDWPDVSPAGLRKMAEIAAPNNGRVFRAAADEIERLAAQPVAQAPEPMRAHVEQFATRAGWNKDEGEGAFEFVQRKCYHQGWQDGRREALGDVHRDTSEVAMPNPVGARAALAAQPEPAAQDIEDAERWRAFISLPYAVRSEWATNLSLAPVLTGWVDSRASYLRAGEAPARGDDGLSESDANQLELAIGELEDDGETMVDYDDLMWFALRGYLHCKYFEVKPGAQEAIDAARAATKEHPHG